MTDKEIIERAKKFDRQVSKMADEFAEREYETDGYERQWLSKGYYHGYMDANKGKLKEPVSEDLEEAAYTFVMEEFGNPKEPLYKFEQRCFKAGAQWQQQQMMKNALDGKMVVGDEPQLVLPSLPTVTRHLEDGDKVKVIILKEE